MSFWQDFKAFVTFKPLPLSPEWTALLDGSQLLVDKKSPVNLTAISFSPEAELLRKYIAADFMKQKIDEVTDYLHYVTSSDFLISPGFINLRDEESRRFGEVTVAWNSTLGNKKRSGFYLKTSETLDETVEMMLRESLKKILAPFNHRPEVGFTLQYKLGPAHKDWKAPEKFKKLRF